MGDEHVLSFLLGEALGVAYLNYMVGVCIIYQNLSNCFLKWWYHEHSHQQGTRVPGLPHPHRYVVRPVFFISAILIGV